MKRSLTALLVAGLGALLVFTLHAQAQRRSSRYGYNRGDNSRYSRQPAEAPAPPASAPATGAAPTAAAAPAPVAYQPSRWSGRRDPLPPEYQILGRKSIFNKDRHAWHPPQTRPALPESHYVPPPKAPAIPVLVGVLLGDDGYIAYIEDPETGRLWPFAAGDQINAEYGYVVEVNLDGIEIAKEGGAPVHIAVGKDLKGQTPDSSVLGSSPSGSGSSSSSAASASGSGATTAPAGSTDTSTLSIEEQMKRRRQQQLSE